MELFQQLLGADHVRHHQKADRIEPVDLAGHANVLLGDIGLRAVRGHANRTDTTVHGHFEVVNRTDTG